MEDVNFPLDQGQVSSALRGLQEARNESSRPRRPEDEEVRNSEQASNDEEAEQTARAERTVIREDRVDATEQARQQDQNVEDDFAEGQEEDVQNPTTAKDEEGVARENLRPLEAAQEFGVDPRGGIPSASERVTDGFRSGNEVTDPDRIDEFQSASRVDSVQEGAERANEEAVSVEPENPSRSLEGSPSIRDVAEGGGAGLQGREGLEESFNSDPPSPEERSAESLEQRPANDAKIQQRIQEARVAEEESRVKNEPALETPEQSIEQVEAPDEPLREAVDNNPLRGPKPSELRDEDASAVETERGQNISNLI
jgi:hypothetical protein